MIDIVLKYFHIPFFFCGIPLISLFDQGVSFWFTWRLITPHTFRAVFTTTILREIHEDSKSLISDLPNFRILNYF